MTQYSQTAVAIYIQQPGRNVHLEFIDTHRVFQLSIAEHKIEPMKNYLLKNLEGNSPDVTLAHEDIQTLMYDEWWLMDDGWWNVGTN